MVKAIVSHRLNLIDPLERILRGGDARLKMVTSNWKTASGVGEIK